MDHLAIYISPIDIPFNLDEHKGEIEKLLEEPEFGYQSFETWLRNHGWDRTRLSGLYKRPGQSQKKNYSMSQILQAWLFFALIASIVRTNKPLFTLEDLVKKKPGDKRILTTKTLPHQLQYWHDWMKTSVSKTEAKERLIDADRTLDLAHKVVRANLVGASFRSEADISLSSDVSDETISVNVTSDYESSSDLDLDLDLELEQEIDDKPQPELALCLMLLGETLSAAKTQIMNDLGLRINGWLTDDAVGWGPPSYVLTRLSTWCPRAQKVLLGQLGSSAFLLFVAFEQRNQGRNQGGDPHGHDECTPHECRQLPGKLPGIPVVNYNYRPRHHEENQICLGDDTCLELGPEMEDVYRILKGANLATEAYEFPLFRIISDNDRHSRVIGITVETWSREPGREFRRPEYATISHVWSQGMGNGNANKLQECQLKFIRQLLEMANIENKDHESPNFVSTIVKKALGEQDEGNRYKISPPFWMDTLAVPVSEKGSMAKANINPEKFTELKQRAIRQIYHVYNSATRVIVIDKELCKTRPHGLASIAIVKILTSAWMRRLWTLQEAFLSRRLSFAFGKEGGGVILEDMDEHISKLGTAPAGDGAEPIAFYLSMAELIKQNLYHNLMGDDREIRNRKDHPIEARGSMVIASAWRSSRWRSTSRLEDETLALSTLLYLDYRGTSIERGGSIAKEKTLKEREFSRETMMQEFWTLIHRNYEGSIPAGLIFLPGKRLSIRGFGWAPTTWLSGQTEDYPYPLSVVGKPTELHEEGLLVQYPGFLLHCGDPSVVLQTDHTLPDLVFPTDQFMSEWYKTSSTRDRIDDGAAQRVISRLRQNEDIGRRPQFGIILSRPKPRERPSEVGLLVEIYREMSRRKEPQRVNRNIYCCQIIRRVWVSRTTKPVSKFRPKITPLGELMPEDTLWYVDGYQDSRASEEFARSGISEGAEDKKGAISNNAQKLGYQLPAQGQAVESGEKDPMKEVRVNQDSIQATNGVAAKKATIRNNAQKLGYQQPVQEVESEEKDSVQGLQDSGDSFQATDGTEDRKGSVSDNLNPDPSRKLGDQHPVQGQAVESEEEDSVGELRDSRGPIWVMNGTSKPHNAGNSRRHSVTTIPETAVPESTTPQPANPQPANLQPANPQPANPQPANPQPANPQPAAGLLRRWSNNFLAFRA